MHGDRAAVLLGDALGDREAEARAALLAARDERLEEAVLDLLRDAGARVGEGDDEHLVGVLVAFARLTLMVNLPPLSAIASAALRARLWMTRRILPSSKRAVPLSCEVDDELDADARELHLELLLHVAEELREVDLADEDVLLAARELEDVALHRADVIELLERELGVLLAQRRACRRAA